MVKAIIFDLQGTLVENGVFPSPLRQVKSILRIDAPFSDFVSHFEHILMTAKQPSLKDAFVNICSEFHVYPKEYLIEKMVGLWNKNKLLSKPYPDTIEVLTELKSDYKLVLVANIDCFSRDVIEKFHLEEYFDLMYLSCETGLLKNDENFYNEILKKLDLDANDVIMVGDSIESDMDTAKVSGIKGVLVDRHNKREFPQKILSLGELKQYI